MPATIKQAYGSVTVKVAAGQTERIATPGFSFVVTGVSGALVYTDLSPNTTLFYVRPDTRPEIPVKWTMERHTVAEPFAALYLRNPTAGELTITLTVGFGQFENLFDPARPVVTVPPLAPVSVTTEVTRPANTTPYAAGQIVGGKFTFGGVGRSPYTFFRLRSLRVTKDSPTTTDASFRLYLIGTNPGTLTDQDPYVLTALNVIDIAAIIDIPAFIIEDATSTAAIAMLNGLDLAIPMEEASAAFSLYGILTARAAYVPASGEKIRVQLYGSPE